MFMLGIVDMQPAWLGACIKLRSSRASGSVSVGLSSRQTYYILHFISKLMCTCSKQGQVACILHVHSSEKQVCLGKAKASAAIDCQHGFCWNPRLQVFVRCCCMHLLLGNQQAKKQLCLFIACAFN